MADNGMLVIQDCIKSHTQAPLEAEAVLTCVANCCEDAAFAVEFAGPPTQGIDEIIRLLQKHANEPTVCARGLDVCVSLGRVKDLIGQLEAKNMPRVIGAPLHKHGDHAGVVRSAIRAYAALAANSPVLAHQFAYEAVVEVGAPAAITVLQRVLDGLRAHATDVEVVTATLEFAIAVATPAETGTGTKQGFRK
jgi:hypothetical protein